MFSLSMPQIVSEMFPSLFHAMKANKKIILPRKSSIPANRILVYLKKESEFSFGRGQLGQGDKRLRLNPTNEK